MAAADILLATDNEVRISVPVFQDSLPVQVGSSLNTQYVVDQIPNPSAGMLRLGNLAIEEGIHYPALIGGIYSGTSIGEKLLPSTRTGLPSTSPDSAYLTSWLNKQWAGVNLNLAHIHLIERNNNQLAISVSRTFSAVKNNLCFSVGEYLFSDLENHYWSRTTDLSLDYWWKLWNFALSAEQRQDANLNEHSVWAAIKRIF